MVSILIKGLVFASLVGMAAAQTATNGKKGIGLTESSGLGAAQLSALQVTWFYNWGAATQIQHAAQFVPMVFSPKRVRELPGQHRVVLGFNEPDNTKQANASPEQALAVWGALRQKADTVGSPALATNPIKQGNWLSTFLGLGAQVDFIAVHWYKGIEADKFIADMQALCKAYGKPVWVTEFAPQTAAQAREEPQKYSQAQVDRFIRDATAWMATSSCVQRYAWHDAKTGTSALFDNERLTATGQTYAAIP